MRAQTHIFSDKTIRRCASVCGLGFFGFCFWAAFVPLDEGIVAQGRVIVENDRRVVQHLEGGIVDDIFVREGDFVDVGSKLLRLSETAQLATRDQLAKQIATLAASRASLIALREGLDQPDFSSVNQAPIAEVEANDIKAKELALFAQRRTAHVAKQSVLIARQEAASQTAYVRAQQITSAEAELEILRTDLKLAEDMFAKKMARRDDLSQLERQIARLEGEIARLESERRSSAATADDFGSQLVQLNAENAQALSQQIRDTQAEFRAATEALTAAQEVLDRVEIVAPVSGHVLNLDVTAKGRVVNPGETLLEIVPPTQSVVVALRVRPSDRSMVYEGLSVRARFSAMRSWSGHEFSGEITMISADLKTDKITGTDYYEALVSIDAHVDGSGAVETVPGMPVDAFIFSGYRRTTFELLFAPLTESIFRGLRAS